MYISINDFDRLVSKIQECQREYNDNFSKMNNIQLQVGNILLNDPTADATDLEDLRNQYNNYKSNCEFYYNEFIKYKTQLLEKVNSFKIDY